MYLNGARRAVAQRDDDILTADELRVHAKEVAAAMLKELLTWAKLKCFSRRKKREANNIIDCRWVIKWKHEIATTSLRTDKSQGPATVEVFTLKPMQALLRSGLSERDSQFADSKIARRKI